MKLLLFLSILTLFSFNNLIGQSKSYSAIIIDRETRKPISFASIFNLVKKNGVYSNETGNFKIDLNVSDTISISCIGYKTIKFVPIDINTLDSISLISDIRELEEVVVYSQNFNYKSIKLGDKRLRSSIHISRSSGFEYATFVPNPQNGARLFIEKISFKIRKSGNQPAAIRVHIYEPDSFFRPAKELLDSNVFIIVTDPGDHNIAVKIKKLQAPFYQAGVFIGVEYLGNFSRYSGDIVGKEVNDLRIGFEKSDQGFKTFERFNKQEWREADIKKLFANSEGFKRLQKGNTPNLSLYIEAVVLND
ncbi:MAG: carboxypeptidase-like regulatory domain-containing protein [Chitinophagales bacterium]|jgi:hypothetical protein|nr:carboxypeptidase-like regulatory domain-containing protein [Chitinophagales bacterium]